MTKKAKGQASMGSEVTYQERKKLEHGSKEARFGVDSQLAFGYCALTCVPVVEPVVTPSGHVYSREAIFEHLLTKTQELRRHQALWDAQEAARLSAASDAAAAESSKRDESFKSTQLVLHSSATSSALTTYSGPASGGGGGGGGGGDVVKAKKRPLEEAPEVIVAELAAEVGKPVTRKELGHVSYWMPEFGPEHVKPAIKPPPARPPSPTTGQGLRLKDLFPINLKVDPDTAGTHEKKYMCAVSGKQITFQPTVLLKSANAVILESVYKDLVVPTMQCPITGAKLKEKDVLKLCKPGSSFAAAGPVKVKVYHHTLT